MKNTNERAVIGIDVGGTAIKGGRFLEDGTCCESLSIPTPQPQYPQDVAEAIAAAVAQLNREGNAIALGVCTPGPADVGGRIARLAINLPGWRDVPLADWLESKTGLPTAIANDANSAALGESWLGAGQGYRDFLLLTLGTGVGGGIVSNQQLFVGHNGAAGELGLIVLYPDGPLCNSGNRGTLEQYLCIRAIRRETGREPDELGRSAQAGDRSALAFWEQYGTYLGIGLSTLTYVLTPEAIAIGGGISASAPFFLPAARAEMARRLGGLPDAPPQLLPAELGNRAGMVGAARLAGQHVVRSGTTP